MDDILQKLENELRRLSSGPHSDEKPSGLGAVRFIARCPFGTNQVLENAKAVLKIVDEAALNGWPSEEEWTHKLPEWFTDRCAAPVSREEAERQVAIWRSLPPDERAKYEEEQDWELKEWLHWLQPENRQWFWWDAKALDDVDHIIVAVQVDGWPFPWGALRWLFKAAGASALEAEE